MRCILSQLFHRHNANPILVQKPKILNLILFYFEETKVTRKLSFFGPKYLGLKSDGSGTYQIIEIRYKAFSTQIILAQFCGTFPADFRCHFVCWLQNQAFKIVTR